MFVETLHTERLWIRPHAEHDFDEVYSMNADADVMRFIGHECPAISSKQQYYHAWYQPLLAYSEHHETGMLAVIDRHSGQYLGLNGIFVPSEEPRYELAFRFQKAAWGKGYATESSRAILHAWFGYKPHSRVVADCHVENSGSQHVLQKLGFVEIQNTYDAAIGGDVSVFELTKERFEHHGR